MKLTQWIKERWRIFWKRWNCEHNVHPDHAKGWVCVKCGKTIWLLMLICAGCSPPRTHINSSGDEIVVTNNAVYMHTWNHSDTYTFLSNAPVPPQ